MNQSPLYLALIRIKDGAPWKVWVDVANKEPITSGDYHTLAKQAFDEFGFGNFKIYERIDFQQPILEPINR